MATPLGNITTTNITPDKDTGIGAYTLAEFDRAMRAGIAKDGHRLFPAMPYPSYANMTESDMKALYSFFMEGVTPVKQAAAPKELPAWMNKPWLLNTGLAAWNALFVPGKGYTAKTEKGMSWNRGAYLVEGLGHCGSCHTPRGMFFQEKAMTGDDGAFMSGAELDHWSAPNLRGDAGDGLAAWTEADVFAFLKTGHGPNTAAFGTMIDVINNSTQFLSDEDLMGMAAYIKSLSPGARPGVKAPIYDAKTTDRLTNADDKTPGEKTYVVQCQGCHGMDGKGKGEFVPPIAGNPAVLDRNPASLINVTLNGSQRLVVGGLPDPYRMVQFRVMLNDREVADVVNFIRSGWGNNAPGTVKAEDVAKVRKDTDPASDQVVILRMR
ncbi:MAG: c-type cytochrome [Rhodospirillaceae bacterium]|nr:c-type cytochrome [Rhodospirillaceae bacterium]